MDVAELISAVAEEDTVGKSVVALVNKVVEGIDASRSKKAVGEIADALNGYANDIADAVIANTLAQAETTSDPLNPTGEKRTADGQPVEPPPSS